MITLTLIYNKYHLNVSFRCWAISWFGTATSSPAWMLATPSCASPSTNANPREDRSGSARTRSTSKTSSSDPLPCPQSIYPSTRSTRAFPDSLSIFRITPKMIGWQVGFVRIHLNKTLIIWVLSFQSFELIIHTKFFFYLVWVVPKFLFKNVDTFFTLSLYVNGIKN